MNWDNIHSVYFIGIGGIGMSALARYFNARGKQVAGYDRTPTELTGTLIEEGIAVHFTDDINIIGPEFKSVEHTLIVYTPAVPSSHTELTYYQANGYTVMKRAQVLGLISDNSRCIAIAGTHGKTTTTSMTAHILKSSGVSVTAFLGGISVNYGSNYITSETTEYTVVEADEFDRSFLQLNPEIEVITSTDADHLDIYGSDQDVKDSFQAFAQKLKPEGVLYQKYGLELNVSSGCSMQTYSAKDTADYQVSGMEVVNGRFDFNVVEHGVDLGRFSLAMPGRHNVENTLAAIAVARKLEVPVEKIQSAVSSFKGVKRRFERIAENDTQVYVDDYAHHPAEIAACVEAARDLFPGKRITGIFQPHLYSRTRDFADGFAESLSKLDALVLMDIYPARELPLEGVDSEMILRKVTISDKQLCGKAELMDCVKKVMGNTDVLITMGAGDIDGFIQPIKKMIETQN